jgi:hypothetical protein
MSGDVFRAAVSEIDVRRRVADGMRDRARAALLGRLAELVDYTARVVEGPDVLYQARKADRLVASALGVRREVHNSWAVLPDGEGHTPVDVACRFFDGVEDSFARLVFQLAQGNPVHRSDVDDLRSAVGLLVGWAGDLHGSTVREEA